jgi:hypothetical protein
LPQLRKIIPPKAEEMKKSGQQAIDDVLSRIEDKLED